MSAPFEHLSRSLRSTAVDDAYGAYQVRIAFRLARHLRASARDDAARRPAMLATNPKYVLRNYLAQVVIEKAELGDFSGIEPLLAVLRAPFDEHPQQAHYAEPAPAWADNMQVSCSS